MDPIKHQLNVKAPVDMAYAAFATEKGIKDWWCADGKVGETPGAPTTLRFVKSDMPAPVVMHFETETLEPGKRVVWVCTSNDNPAWVGTKLSWEIGANRGGSVVSFTHDGWSEGGPLYDATVEGWQYFIASLQSYLDGGPATPQ